MARMVEILEDIQLRNWVKAGKPVAKADGGGLTFTLSKAGTASWVLRYRFGGKQREVTLGNYPDMGLSAARKEAKVRRGEVAHNVDVAAAKQATKAAEKTAGTVRELCNEYFETSVEGKVKRPEMIREMLDNDILRVLGRMKVDEVKPINIDRMIKIIVNRGSKVMANRVLSLTKAVFDHAIRMHWIDQNPAGAFGRKQAGGKEKSRTRSLKDGEIVKIFKVLDEAGSDFRIYALMVRLLLLTAVRKSELVEAPWDEFDLTKGEWTLPPERRKTGEDDDRLFVIPLTAIALEWLREVKRLSVASDYVFPARKRGVRQTMAPETLNWALGQLDFEIDPFTVHDLRRTARTHLGGLGVAPHVSERYLGHKLPGVVGTYDVNDYLRDRRAAMELWGAKLASLERNEPFNVVPLVSAA